MTTSVQTTLNDHGTSWQTNGKWSVHPAKDEPGQGYATCDGYGTIQPERVQPWHVDATGTEDHGFTGTFSFPMVRPGHDHRDGFGKALGSFDYCSPVLWASLWSHVPGAVVTCPAECRQLLTVEEIAGSLRRGTYLRWREYCGELTAAEFDELRDARAEADARRATEERNREEYAETPAADGRITWKGRQYDPPTMGEVEEWAMDSVCETPDGERVEPDHPDSWLSILGLV